MDDATYIKIKNEIESLRTEIKAFRAYVDEQTKKNAELAQLCVNISNDLAKKE